jgi:hypothetical protein
VLLLPPMTERQPQRIRLLTERTGLYASSLWQYHQHDSLTLNASSTPPSEPSTTPPEFFFLRGAKGRLLRYAVPRKGGKRDVPKI